MADAAPLTPGGVPRGVGAPCAEATANAGCAAGAQRAGLPVSAKASGSSAGERARPLSLLVLAPGSRGDVQPLLAVVRLLLRGGHSVRFVCHDAFRESVEALNADDGDGSLRGVVRFCRVAGTPRAGQRDGTSTSGAAAEEAWRQQLADYSAAAALAPLDAVLFNWFGMAGVHLAESLQVPVLALWPGAPVTRTRAFACPLLPGLAASAGKDAALLGYVSLEAMLWRASEVPLNAWRQDVLGLAPLRDGLGHFAAMARAKVPVLYGYSARACPPPADWPARVLTVGPWSLPSPRAWTPPSRLLQFLERAGAQRALVS